MKNIDILKKKILYRSVHRGTKEMDLLLGNFVKKHVDKFNDKELEDLAKLLLMDDETINKWYFEKSTNMPTQSTKVSKLLKDFKI